MASGKKTVIVALIGNTFVGICKFIDKAQYFTKIVTIQRLRGHY